MACTNLLTYLFIQLKRAKEALESTQGVVSNAINWTVHDCRASYFVAGKGRHSLCGAHLLGEWQNFIDTGREWAQLRQTYWPDLYELTRQEPLANDLQAQWRARYEEICQQGPQSEPPPAAWAPPPNPRTQLAESVHRPPTCRFSLRF